MSLTTKRALAASLKNMLVRKTLDKITVKDIVDDCNLNRQTFYYHFHDTYDLLEWLYVDETKDIINRLHEKKYSLLLDYIIKNKSLILNTYHSLDQEYAENKIKECVKPIIFDIIKKYSSADTPEEDLNFISDLYSYSLIGLLIDWLHNDLSEEYIPRFYKFKDILMSNTHSVSNQ